jgi:predicted transposase/invertase (TIGR01784 family)
MKDFGVFIDPYTDFGFKRIFGQDGNVDLLIDFLNTVLQPDRLIVSLKFLNTEQPGILKGERKAVFDTYCEDEAGNKFIIELQRIREEFFKDRSLFYSTIPIRGQAKSGEWNFKLKQTLIICIMDFVFDDYDSDEMIHEVTLIDKASGKVFNQNLIFWYLEMPKFKKKIADVGNRRDEWFFILNNLSALQEIPLSLKSDPIFKKLFMEAEISNYSEEQAEAYYASMKERWDRFAIEETARKEGRLEGKLEGRQEGKLENALAIALQMKRANEPLEKIVLYTGLEISRIEELH